MCLTSILLAAAWMSWNYRADGILTWPDTQDYADVASEPVLSRAFWSGGNPPILPLLFKAFGLTSRTFMGPDYPVMAHRITQVQTAFSFLAAASLALSFASVLRQKWLRPVAVMVILGLGLAIDVAQWNKMLLTESLSSSLLFGIVAGAIVWIRWWEGPGSPKPLVVSALAIVLALGAILHAFARDVNPYVWLVLGFLTLPPTIVAIVRRRERRWAYLAIVGIFFLAGGSSAVARRSHWSYPFINLVYDRVLPDHAALGFFVRRGFPIDVIETITPPNRKDLHVAFRSDPRAEPLRAWYEANGQTVYLEFLASRPIDTLRAPLSHLATLLSPDVSWYRVRLHPDPAWMPLAGAVVYPRSTIFLVLWSVAVVICSAILVRRGFGRPVWAVPLLMMVTLYPLMLIIWHGDSAALERHSLPVGVGLRLCLWMLSFLLVDGYLSGPRIGLGRGS
ncbi:MAG TPA: hypothetical protein VLD63_12710 [Anaerolineales bacterium]|nr:hypothetical protein [Anaerolineales bacterium]